MKALARSLYRRVLPERVRGALARLRGGVLVEGPLRYNDDGLATRHHADFLSEPRFARAYAAGKATGAWGGRDVHWRAHVACWAASRGLAIEGDFVECGVDRGGLAMTVATYVDFERLERKFWLLDTYEGLVERLIRPDERARGIEPGGYAPCYDEVCRTFARFRNVRIVRGAVPDTLPEVTATRIAYLSIDMNCVEPEVAAVRRFWPLLSSGAVVLLDDYGWNGHEAQKEAFDALAVELGVPLLCLPTGQAVWIKP